MTLEINQTINQLVIQQTTGDTLEITTQGPQGPPGATYSFTVAGNSGPSQTINDGDTLTLTSPVSFQQVVMSADTATFSWPVQVANTFLSGPNTGANATPAFRTVVVADIATALNTGGFPATFTDLNVTGNTTLGTNNANTLTLNVLNVSIPNNLNFDSNTFFIDSANNRVAIGTTTFTSASTVLQISGNRVDILAATTTMFLRLTNSGSALMEIGTTSTRGYFESSQTLSFRVNGSDRGGIDTGGIAIWGVATTQATPNYRVNASRLSALTNVTDDVLSISHNTSGTPAAGFGARMGWFLESSTTENRIAAAMDVVWTTATDATRTSRMDFYVTNSGTLTNVAQLSAAGFQAPFGLFNAPGLTFVGDTDTGIYRSSSDVLGFTTGASTRFTLSNNGLIASVNGSFTYSDGGTNDTQTVFVIGRSSSGTPAANFASRVIFNLESDTTDNTNAANIITSWVVATHGSRTARVVFNVFDTAAREAIRIQASGSAPMLSFYGETATIRYATTGTTTGFTAGAGAAVDSAATFTGNVGATAYTIGDIVRALKLVGIMTQ